MDCVLLHASAWERLCKLYLLVVPVKPVGCWTYKGNNYALVTFGQVSPGLPGTTLMRCPDKPDSLKNTGSFLHFNPMSFPTQSWESLPLSLPRLKLCVIRSHRSRGGCGKRIQEETNTRSKILYIQLILTGNILLLLVVLGNYFQDTNFTLFHFCVYFFQQRIQFLLS